jgi:hypothetical protein
LHNPDHALLAIYVSDNQVLDSGSLSASDIEVLEIPDFAALCNSALITLQKLIDGMLSVTSI